MFLVDTNVISERRKGHRADSGVLEFFKSAGNAVFLPAQVAGELQAGVQRLRQRGDEVQALRLQEWYQSVLEEFSFQVLPFDLESAKLWGILLGLNEQHTIDKQIAAIALVYDLTVVTRNTAHFSGTGVRVLNPFVADSGSSPAEKTS